ncbi:MAG: hypothetical protein JWQ09_2016 [Segetibacter sp.]|nr:hypothetical protein [Segetibacter sp.]
MRKLILLNVLLLSVYISSGQYNPRPSRSRFYNSKTSTFTIKAGDILLYTVSKDSQRYDMVITVKKYGNTVSFNYSIPDKTETGTVLIQASAVKNALVYDTLLTGSSKNYKDTSIFWLSKKNYTDLAEAKETIMDLGNGKETFKRQRVSTLKLNYKGKEKIVTVFGIENSNQTAKKGFSVLSEGNNPLIVKMDSGWTLTLKEVR